MPTFYDRFVECAERWPNNVALELQRHDHIESCTYAELRRMAESVGRWITEKQFPRGSRLAILADNHPRWVAAYLGIIASGCAAVPLDTALHDDQVTKLLKDSGASAVFCDAKHVPVARPAATELKLGMILIDPDRMTGHSNQESWLGDCPPSSKLGPGTFKPDCRERWRSRFPALYLRHHRRSQGRDADARQFPGRSRGGIQLGRPWAHRRAARRVAPVSRAGPDGQSAAASGQGIAGCLSGDAQHHRTPARADRAQHHGVCGRSAILLPDS